MKEKKSNRRSIQLQSASFKLYVDNLLMHNSAKELVDYVAQQVPIYVFSGLIRNFLLGYLNNRDIDFVLFDTPHLKLPYSLLKDVYIKKNKFGGYKLLTDDLTIDVWDIERTWGILEERMRASVNSLLDTAFFNFSAIAYDYHKSKFIFSDEFEKFYATHVMEVVYERNPKKETCIVNALYYADKYEFIIGNSLRKWIVKYYNGDYDYKAAQESRFQKILYSDSLIKAFASPEVKRKQPCSSKKVFLLNALPCFAASSLYHSTRYLSIRSPSSRAPAIAMIPISGNLASKSNALSRNDVAIKVPPYDFKCIDWHRGIPARKSG